MLLKMNTKKQSSFAIAVTGILFLQYVGSILANSHTPPQNNNNPTPSNNKVTRPLPGPDLEWKIIRNRSCLYIDKTKYLWKLVVNQTARRRLITRSRRFGKSLFLQMMEQFFRGRSELFEGLFIGKWGNRNTFIPLPKPDDGGDWIEYPVIKLNFKLIEKFTTIYEFKSEYYKILTDIAKSYKIEDFESGYGSTRLLISALYCKFNSIPVIVLVDEYDYPYEYAISKNNIDLAKEIREFLDDIFGIIKNESKRVAFLFLTGVSKLTLAVLQSGANNIVDETYNPEFAEAFGFTEEEITEHMRGHIEEFAKSESVPFKDIMDKMRIWYDGYQFDPNNRSQRVFNPVSTISNIRNKKFGCYWIQTGSMDPIPGMFYKEGWSLDVLLKGMSISQSIISGGSIESQTPTLILWMFHNGYYTMNGQDSSDVIVKIPNFEIETAINTSLLSYDPIAQLPYAHYCLSELLLFKNNLRYGNVRAAMSILQKIGFPAYAHPLNQEITAGEVTRRLTMLFEIATIKHENGMTFKKIDGENDDGGDIDMWTKDLPTNYAIEVKISALTTGNLNAAKGMRQFLDYVRDYRDSLMQKLGNPTRFFFLSIAFEIPSKVGKAGTASLASWIFLPVNNSVNNCELLYK
ncbi:uncharacterized protein in vnfD 5'region-like [Planococcus citri]|uniref:uncharacterized protein in vnfD 5'region-like n=1 Tax=Planococcus citri TaxID=170843 RepID=UPI0031F7332A